MAYACQGNIAFAKREVIIVTMQTCFKLRSITDNANQRVIHDTERSQYIICYLLYDWYADGISSLFIACF